MPSEESSSAVTNESSIEEILTPTVVATTKHAHDLPAGVQRKRTGLAQQNHVVDFMQKAVAFAPIAGVAAGDKILPRGVAAPGTRYNVIEREFAGREDDSAILASVAIAQEDVLTREGTGLVRNAAVLQQADDGRHCDAAALRMQHEAVLLLSARDALKHQHECAPRATDVNGLVRRIEHQHWHLQDLCRLRAVLPGGVLGSQRRSPGDRFLLACMNHCFSQRHPLPPVKKMVGSASTCLPVVRRNQALRRFPIDRLLPRMPCRPLHLYDERVL
jgi:hypothetical protein